MKAFDLQVTGSLIVTGSIRTTDGTFILSGSDSNASASFSTRVTTNESNITLATASIAALTASISRLNTEISTDDTDMTLATASIALNESNMTLATASIALNESNMTLATASIAAITSSIADNLDQAVKQASAVTFATVDTGQGANELYDMNQNVKTDSNVTFGDINSSGTITAVEVHTTFVSSSIAVISGSNNFGDALDDHHSFTGSLSISGSGTITGSFTVEGPSTIDELTATSLTATGNISSSITSTGSFGRVSATDIDLSSIKGNWTNAGNTVADLGSITTVDINGGTINGITDLAVADGGTGASTLNDLITLSTHTTGNYVGTITGGTGITSTAATSGEGTTHSLSVDAAQTQITSVGTLTSLTTSGTLTVSSSTVNDDFAIFKNTNTTAGASVPIFLSSMSGGSQTNVSIENAGAGSLILRTGNTAVSGYGTTALTIDSSQNATFAGDVRSVGTGVRTIRLESTTNAQNLNLDFFNNANAIAGRITYQEGAGAFYFQPNQAGGGTALTLDWSNNATFAGQVKIDTTERYFTKWESTYGTARDYWWRNDGGTLQLGEGAEGDGQVMACFDTAQKRLGLGTRSPQKILHLEDDSPYTYYKDTDDNKVWVSGVGGSNYNVYEDNTDLRFSIAPGGNATFTGYVDGVHTQNVALEGSANSTRYLNLGTKDADNVCIVEISAINSNMVGSSRMAYARWIVARGSYGSGGYVATQLDDYGSGFDSSIALDGSNVRIACAYNTHSHSVNCIVRTINGQFTTISAETV